MPMMATAMIGKLVCEVCGFEPRSGVWGLFVGERSIEEVYKQSNNGGKKCISFLISEILIKKSLMEEKWVTHFKIG